MTNLNNRPKNRWTGPLAAAIVALAVTMAGCAGPGEANEAGENRAPDAVLETSKNHGFTDESFTFDGSKSDDPDGEIIEWRFDFGDGTRYVATSEDQAKPTHVFLTGGEYTVTLTVMDEGKDTAGAKSDLTTRTVAVNERDAVPTNVVFSAPTSSSDNSTAVYRQEFRVGEDADRIEVSMDARSAVVAGESRIEVRVLDDEDNTISRDEKTIAANQNETFDLNDITLNNDQGMYTLEVIAHSGGASFDGEIEVYYDMGYAN